MQGHGDLAGLGDLRQHGAGLGHDGLGAGLELVIAAADGLAKVSAWLPLKRVLFCWKGLRRVSSRGVFVSMPSAIPWPPWSPIASVMAPRPATRAENRAERTSDLRDMMTW